jgi:hypothetical protein
MDKYFSQHPITSNVVSGMTFCWTPLKCDAIFLIVLDVNAFTSCLATVLQPTVTVNRMLSNQVNGRKKEGDLTDQFRQEML